MSAVKQAASMRPNWEASSAQGRKLAPAAYPKLSARIAWFPGWERADSEHLLSEHGCSEHLDSVAAETDFPESDPQQGIQDPG
jgi:hypothetical protein